MEYIELTTVSSHNQMRRVHQEILRSSHSNSGTFLFHRAAEPPIALRLGTTYSHADEMPEPPPTHNTSLSSKAISCSSSVESCFNRRQFSGELLHLVPANSSTKINGVLSDLDDNESEEEVDSFKSSDFTVWHLIYTCILYCA